MTLPPVELARIRKRDVDSRQMDEPYVLVACLIQAEDDRRDLLAEVDRLSAMHPYGSQQEVGAAFAVMDERARIAGAVKGLPSKFASPGFIVDALDDAVDREAVLRIVGESPKE